MRHRRRNNLKLLLFVLLISISLGYAFLQTDLTINGTSKISATSWDIHFNNVQITTGSVSLSEGDSIPTIDTTTKTDIAYTVTLHNPGDFYEFTVDVVNAGTLDGMIDTVSSKMNGITISTLPAYMKYSVTYSNDMPIKEKHLLASGITDTYKVRIEYRTDINPSDLPSTLQTNTFAFGVTYIQADDTAVVRPNPPTIRATSSTDTTAFRSSTYKTNIKTITFEEEINVPNDAVASWDIGVDQNGNVMAYVMTNADDNTKYDLYIQGDGLLYANPDSSYMFYNLTRVDAIYNLDVLNTSKVTNMKYMFNATGYSSTVFTLDLGDNFHTSKVRNMESMFRDIGHNSTAFTLNLGSNFDTSSVTNMKTMFAFTGSSSPVFTLDLGDKFDTSNVTNMDSMFWGTGEDATMFTLDLGSKFDTSSVTNMYQMFENTGHSSTVFTLDLGSKFDTSKVTNMSNMFCATGEDTPVFTLDLGPKFDTSSVTDMSNMFWGTGYNSTVFTLDLGDKFDTSKVTNMDSMFCQAGAEDPVFTLNLGSKFNTSKVTNMSSMFQETGHYSDVFTLDLGNLFDTSRVTDMSWMFYDVGSSSTAFTLNLGDNFDTSRVTDMSYMFSSVGYVNPNFVFELGDLFDTSNVEDMTDMFSYVGHYNTSFVIDLSTFDFSNVTEYSGIFNGFESTQIIYVKDTTAQSWVITNSGNSNLTTANVLIKP